MTSVQVGQLYRDTYHDKHAPNMAHRTIRIVEIIGDKVRSETVIDATGNTLDKPQKNGRAISFKTLASGYVAVTP